jgi:hypothetical protein
VDRHPTIHREHQGDAQWRANPPCLLAKATELGILCRLARQELSTSVSIYADDVVIFFHPDEPELRAIGDMLELFGHTSGLHTNFAKCSVSPIACLKEVATTTAVVTEC